MSETSSQAEVGGVHLPRTIAAVREALPSADAEEFSAVVDSTEVVELPGVFEHWWRRAVLNQRAGLLERIEAGRGSGTGRSVAVEDVFPGYGRQLAARRDAA